MRPVRREGGFVLVLVLAMLVVLSLLAGSIAATTSRLLEQATQRERGMQDQLDMASTRATVLYLIGTQRLTVGGLTVDNLVSFGEDGVRPSQSPADIEGNGLLLPVGTEIAMDGRAYRGIGNARFARPRARRACASSRNCRTRRTIARPARPRSSSRCPSALAAR